jgi:hypothetical protein
MGVKTTPPGRVEINERADRAVAGHFLRLAEPPDRPTTATNARYTGDAPGQLRCPPKV